MFCLMMEGYRPGSGSVQIITDSDPEGPETVWILKIQEKNSRNGEIQLTV
jgi:hypothetical protein